jgi:hypothetical protein
MSPPIFRAEKQAKEQERQVTSRGGGDMFLETSKQPPLVPSIRLLVCALLLSA